MGSTDAPPKHNNKASPSSNNPPGGKEVSATMKVWKLLRPGLHRHLSLSGMYTCLLLWAVYDIDYRDELTNDQLKMGISDMKASHKSMFYLILKENRF